MKRLIYLSVVLILMVAAPAAPPCTAEMSYWTRIARRSCTAVGIAPFKDAPFIPSTGPYGSFTNTATGTLLLSNSSGASDQGTFVANRGTSSTNHGTMTINDAHSSMHVDGSLTSHGEILDKGTFRAISPSASPTRAQGSSTTIPSEVHNDNNAVISNLDSYSLLELGSGSRVFNAGLIEHKKGVIRPGASSPGRIDNFSKTDLSVYGTLNKYCDGSITLDYYYIEPDPVDLCVGTIVIKKDTVPDGPADFSFSGDLGDFSLDDDADPTTREATLRTGFCL